MRNSQHNLDIGTHKDKNSFIFTSHLRQESPCTLLPIVVNSINLITDSCVLILYLYFDYIPLSELASNILLNIFILMISNWRSRENSHDERMSSLLCYFLTSLYLSYHISTPYMFSSVYTIKVLRDDH